MKRVSGGGSGCGKHMNLGKESQPMKLSGLTEGKEMECI